MKPYTQQQALSQVLKNLLKGVKDTKNPYEEMRAENQNIREWKDNGQETSSISHKVTEQSPDTQIITRTSKGKAISLNLSSKKNKPSNASPQDKGELK